MRLFGIYRELTVTKKAAIWYTICNFFQKGIAFLVVPIYVHYLSSEEYGQYSIFQSWCGIIIIFATLNLYCGVFTKAMVDYSDDRDRYTSSMQSLSTIITAFLFLVYYIYSSFWEKTLEMDNITIYLMFAYFVTFPAFSFWSVRQRVENKYKTMVVLTLLQSLATPAISLYLLFYTNLRVNAVIWGFLLSQIAFGLFFYIYQFFKGRCFYHKDYWIHALKFNIPLIPHYLSLVVLGQIDRILIGNFNGKDKAGIYSLATQVAMVISIVIQGINQAFVPWVYERFKERTFSYVRSQSNMLCILVGVMVFLYMLVSPEIIRIMGTKEYMDAIWVMPAAGLSVYITFCYGLYSCIEFYYDATTYVMIATTSGAALSVVMNMLLLPRFGFISAGYTSLTCYAFFMMMHYFFQKRICKKTLSINEVFDNRFIFLSCLALLCFMFVCLILYKHIIIRYTVFVLILLLVYIKREKVRIILQYK